jgi:uncharacterized protein (TIGR00304 family)
VSYYSLLGSLLLLVGVAVLVLATVISSRRGDRAEVKAAGVVLIGPIPIIFGTDTKWVIVAIVLAMLLVALTFVTNFR